MSIEPIEREEKMRYTIFPIEYPDLYDMYKKLRESHWIPEELKEELAKDSRGWKQLDANSKHFIKTIVAFFAISDTVVNQTLEEELLRRVKVPEIKVFWRSQSENEDIHAESYSLFVDEYIDSPEERNTIFKAIENFPAIRKKIEWLRKWVGRENPFKSIPDTFKPTLRNMALMFQKTTSDFLHLIEYNTELEDPAAPIPKLDQMLNHIIDDKRTPLAQIILANCIMEGLFFSGSFAAIFWVNHYFKGLLPGLAFANSMISRDEGQHCDFAILLYRKYIVNKLPESTVHQMFREAVDVETNFIEAALPANLKGMNAALMTKYIHFVADQLMKDLGYNPLFGENKCPLEFMDKQSISVRISDFFVNTVSEYGLTKGEKLSFDENF
jgi:ribonucleotide reductase beta subunit family protein with ferritin-like domain